MAKLLIIPGSLRMNSSTRHLVSFIVSELSNRLDAGVYEDVGTLPHFNDVATPPANVERWRAEISGASSIVIVTPEYAHGVPGSLKNALDWLVGTGNLSDKPVALITASTGGTYGHESMLQTLQALNAKVNAASALLISHIRSKMSDDGTITDDTTKQAIREVLKNFIG